MENITELFKDEHSKRYAYLDGEIVILERDRYDGIIERVSFSIDEFKTIVTKIENNKKH
jgi:hypothetical protein